MYVSLYYAYRYILAGLPLPTRTAPARWWFNAHQRARMTIVYGIQHAPHKDAIKTAVATHPWGSSGSRTTSAPTGPRSICSPTWLCQKNVPGRSAVNT